MCCARAGVCALVWGFVLVSCDDPKQAPAAEPPYTSDQAEQTRCEPGLLQPCDRACKEGDNAACEQLTAMYLRGIGVERSDRAAAALNRRLCQQGRRYFCPTYAFVLLTGRGVPMDGERARELFADNCQYDPKACSEYGSLVAAGTGVPQDLVMGTYLLDLACRHGDAQACNDLRRVQASDLDRQRQ